MKNCFVAPARLGCWMTSSSSAPSQQDHEKELFLRNNRRQLWSKISAQPPGRGQHTKGTSIFGAKKEGAAGGRAEMSAVPAFLFNENSHRFQQKVHESCPNQISKIYILLLRSDVSHYLSKCMFLERLFFSSVSALIRDPTTVAWPTPGPR